MEGLTEGRIVHYVLPDGENKGKIRPAIVVDSWPNAHPGLRAKGYCNLIVFLDNGDYVGKYTIWKGTVTFSDNNEPNTWHWIPRA